MLGARATPLQSIDQAILREFSEMSGFNVAKFPFRDDVVRLVHLLLYKLSSDLYGGKLGGGRSESEGGGG